MNAETLLYSPTYPGGACAWCGQRFVCMRDGPHRGQFVYTELNERRYHASCQWLARGSGIVPLPRVH